MSQVRLWLSIKSGTDLLGNINPVMYKTVETGFLPRSGDHIQILRSMDPPEGWSVEQEVKSVYWDGDGNVNVVLTSIYIDPSEIWQTTAWKHESAWYTDQDGDNLIERLFTSGWEPYQ